MPALGFGQFWLHRGEVLLLRIPGIPGEILADFFNCYLFGLILIGGGQGLLFAKCDNITDCFEVVILTKKKKNEINPPKPLC